MIIYVVVLLCFKTLHPDPPRKAVGEKRHGCNRLKKIGALVYAVALTCGFDKARSEHLFFSRFRFCIGTNMD
ncbi:hypothetical protein C8R44DRAFT_776647 [Mycena epipterygia]|nr:hypothetical protein C8R44DRAFT_776647 [Mycena epipterygia]